MKTIALTYLLTALTSVAATIPFSQEPVVTSVSTNDMLLISSYGPGNQTRQVAIKNLPPTKIDAADITNIVSSVIATWSLSPGTISFISNPRTYSYAPPVSSMYWRSVSRPATSDLMLVRSDGNGSWRLNDQGGTPTGTASLSFGFTPPYGTTNVIIDFWAKRSGAANASFYYGFYGPLSAVYKVALDTTTDASWHHYSTNTTYGYTNLEPFIIMSASGNQITVSNVTVTCQPTPTNIVLQQSFARYDVLPRYTDGAVWVVPQVMNNVFFGNSEETKTSFLTSAKNVTLELMCQGGTFPVAVYTNGFLYALWTPPMPNGIPWLGHYYDITGLPGKTLITVVNSSALQVPGDNSLYNVTGVKAIYVPAGEYVQFQHDEPKRKVFVFGDSIMSDSTWLTPPGLPENGIWGVVERTADINYLLYAASWQPMYWGWQSNQFGFNNALVSYKPTDVWIAIGVNDYAMPDLLPGYVGYTGTNDFAEGYKSMLLSIHTNCPGANIYAQTPILKQVETANTNGYTLTQYRQAISNACEGLSFVHLVDGTSIVLTNDLYDGIHPSATGNAKYSAFIYHTMLAK